MADSVAKPPPPLLFQRPSTIAPKTIPPPLPPLAKQQTVPSITHHASLSISQSHSSQHSRHNSASSTLATLEEEDGMIVSGKGGRVSFGGEQAGVGVIQEYGEEEEKEFVEGHEAVEEEEDEETGEEHKEAGEEDEDEEDTEAEEEGEFEVGVEEEYDSGDQSEPDVLRIRGDSHPSMSASHSPHSIPQSPVSRAFAIFGREIRHVSPNSSFSSDKLPVLLAIPNSQKRTPRTVPPPLPPVLSPTSPSVTAASPSSKSVVPVMSLSVPPRSPQALDVPPPLSPLQSPVSPTTPSSPAGVMPISPAEMVSPIASAQSSPAFMAHFAPPPPPMLPLHEMSRSTSQASSVASTNGSASATPVHARSAANSLAAVSSTSRPVDSSIRVRATAPSGFQFPTGKLNARAAPAADSLTPGASSAAHSALSASTPLLSHSNADTPPSSADGAVFSPSFTAPSAFASPSNRNSTTSAPSSPRRMPSSTVSAPPMHSLGPRQDSEPVAMQMRPATAGEASRPDARRRGVAPAATSAENGTTPVADNQPQQGKHKCSKCISFSVRGSYCYKHLYHAGLAALAAPNVQPSALPPLSHTLSASSQPYLEKMFKIADELLKTEKTYYEALKIAYRSFQLRLEVAAQLADNPAELSSNVGGGGGSSEKGSGGRRDPLMYLPVLSTAEIGTIFSKLNDIFTLSSNLYHDLNTLNSIRIYTHQPHRTSTFGSATSDSASSAPSTSSSSHLTLLLPFLGSTLLHYSSYFRVYQSYLENYDDAIKTLVQQRRERDVLDVWLTWNEKCEGVSIDSLLIQPVQRLPRYLLLLQEIIKAEDQRRANDAVDANSGLFTHYPQGYTDILTAREKISRIADAINSSLHDKETAAVVSHLQSLFEHDSHFVPFATPTRTLVKEGLLKKINETRRNAVFGASSWYHFFLFNDLFLYAEEIKKIGGTVRYKLKNTVPLLDLSVVETGVEKGGTMGGKADKCWALRNEVTGKLLTLSCKSEKERTEWCEAIRGMQRKLRELSESMHVNTFDGVTRQEKKEKANLNKAKLMMGIGG